MKQSLWTIQHAEAYELLKREGVLRSNERFLICDGNFRNAYNWMAGKLAERVCSPPYGVRYPIWAWYQWEGMRRRRDLRQSGYAPRGTPMVQIEFEVEENEMLLSDFDDWHHVLNNSYITDNRKDFEEFYSRRHTDSQSVIEQSWDKIFDLHRYEPDWDTPKIGSPYKLYYGKSKSLR